MKTLKLYSLGLLTLLVFSAPCFADEATDLFNRAYAENEKGEMNQAISDYRRLLCVHDSINQEFVNPSRAHSATS